MSSQGPKVPGSEGSWFGAARAVARVLVTAAAVLSQASAQSGTGPLTQDVVRLIDASVRPKVLVKRLPDDRAPDVPAGQLLVEFVIERDGSVQHARVAGDAAPYARLQGQTIELLKQWKFVPGTKDGVVVRVLATLTVSFDMRSLPGRGAPRPPAIVPTWTVEGVDDDFGAGVVRLPASGVTMPRILKQAKPGYPQGAKDDGEVQLDLVILATGRVGAARVVRSTDAHFDAEALKTVRQWVFEPGMKDGQPVPVIASAVLDFRRR